MFTWHKKMACRNEHSIPSPDPPLTHVVLTMLESLGAVTFPEVVESFDLEIHNVFCNTLEVAAIFVMMA